MASFEDASDFQWPPPGSGDFAGPCQLAELLLNSAVTEIPQRDGCMGTHFPIYKLFVVFFGGFLTVFFLKDLFI